ncbi:sodium channel protein Nach-like isoform X1 [Anopheles albimanus]|uniref:sodium channel protein Nach-like isoform X1 n=2 Tax=Anopheles albimanus TaxID=7167 RepID=UPI00163FA1E3|nr:sodium channel protein Nach-like isoform X1 [Anopheles albimanus]
MHNLFPSQMPINTNSHVLSSDFDFSDSSMVYQFSVTKAIQNVLSQTSLHGVFHLANKQSTYFEKVLWLVIICLSLTAGSYTVGIFWIRYWNNPTMIALDRDYHLWNTTFPSLTVCFQKRLNERARDELVANIDPTLASRYSEFLDTLLDSDIEHVGALAEYDEFEGVDLKELLNEITDRPSAFITLDGDVQGLLLRTMTEMGICYTFNSAIGRYMSVDKYDGNSELYQVSVFDGESSATISNCSSNANIYFHSPYEMPTPKKSLQLERGFFTFTKMEFKSLAISSEPSVQYLSIQQRKCRFPHESNLRFFPDYYSYDLCLLECKFYLFLKHCDCIPYFYNIQDRSTKYCKLTQLGCIELYQSYISFLTADELREIFGACKCVKNCDDVTFTLQQFESTFWFNDPVIKWSTRIPKIRYSRRIIYDFIDALVSTGSILEFFFGFSLITLVELGYFSLRNLILSFVHLPPVQNFCKRRKQKVSIYIKKATKRK